MLLPSLSHRANVAVIGASGAIGGEFVSRLSSDDGVAAVHAFARTPSRFDHIGPATHPLDVTDEDSIRQAVATLGDEPLDLVIVATGILHRDDDIRPEKSMQELNKQAMIEVLTVNAIGPALVAKHFLPRMRRKGKTVFAALSARVGSIGDNRLGGWLSYRASKAALNMLLATLAIEHARSRPDSVVVGLHPGTVNSNLSQPFTGNLREGLLFSPKDAATYLLEVIDRLSAADTGDFFAWDGSRIVY